MVVEELAQGVDLAPDEVQLVLAASLDLVELDREIVVQRRGIGAIGDAVPDMGDDLPHALFAVDALEGDVAIDLFWKSCHGWVPEEMVSDGPMVATLEAAICQRADNSLASVLRQTSIVPAVAMTR